MSDQFGNNVDGEIRVPVKGWEPLGRNSWIEKPEEPGFPSASTTALYYGVKDGSQKPGVTTSGLAFLPLKSWSEWGIALADGSIGEVLYKSEGEARGELQYQRSWLAKLGVPEEYWPVLMVRTVENVATSWSILSV